MGEKDIRTQSLLKGYGGNITTNDKIIEKFQNEIVAVAQKYEKQDVRVDQRKQIHVY